jgi:hypothetical protein
MEGARPPGATSARRVGLPVVRSPAGCVVVDPGRGGLVHGAAPHRT